jgi:glycosyltransferase involved in cell wall biosynthesis
VLGISSKQELDIIREEMIRMDQRRETQYETTENYSLSVIIPAYNEEEVLKDFHRRLAESVDNCGAAHIEMIYVNDGSSDRTLSLLLLFTKKDDRVQVIDLSRNFGKEAAMTAGLDASNGDVVVIIDADLQDPPELIPQMVAEWQKGFDVVLMRRSHRNGESWLKKSTAKGFYWIISRASQVHIPENVGDFRLMSRRTVTSFRKLTERTRFMKGLFAWIGYPTTEISYERDSRYSGETKWSFWKLWNFALEGFTSFTTTPLKIASYIGGCTALCSLGYGLVVLIKAVIWGDPVPGYPSLMVTILFLGGLQLLATGVVGEYLGRMFLESKKRPIYLVNAHHNEPRSRTKDQPKHNLEYEYP